MGCYLNSIERYKNINYREMVKMINCYIVSACLVSNYKFQNPNPKQIQNPKSQPNDNQ